MAGSGKVYSSYTNEIYNNKSETVYATFRAYNNIEESIEDYYKLIEKNYKKALNCKSQKECISEIKNGGYATDPDYVNKIMSIINANNFIEKYDKKEDIYTTGHYYVNTNGDVLNVRSKPGLTSKILNFEELTKNAQKQVLENNSNKKVNGLVAGVEVDVSKVIEKDGFHWGKIPSGFIALEFCSKG